ncbi:MAG: hypothetical protein KGL75_06230, partial [Acidobacteriota bacterium]|nr:hypothetical protein [Acidobacteriota bacterium]
CGDSPNRGAVLQLQDNAPGSPQAISLSGSAADFCPLIANGQPNTAAIQPGQTASFSLQIASTGGFSNTVDLSCSVAPAGSNVGPCAISTTPATNPPSVQVTPTSSGQFIASVPTVAPIAAALRSPGTRSGPKAGNFALACVWLAALILLALCSLQARRDSAVARGNWALRHLSILAFATILAAGISACGSGGGGGAGPQPTSGTSPGTYTVTLTASTAAPNAATRTATLTFTVQ